MDRAGNMSSLQRLLAANRARAEADARDPAAAEARKAKQREEARAALEREAAEARARATIRTGDVLRRIGVPHEVLEALSGTLEPRPTLAAAKRFALATREEACFLLLLGPPGTGKTLAAAMVARRCCVDVLARGGVQHRDPAAFVLGSKLARLSLYGDDRGAFDALLEVPCLVLDDLSRAFTSKVAGPLIFELLATRHAKRKATVITDNKTEEEFAKWCSSVTGETAGQDPLWDRISTSAIVCEAAGKSLRRKAQTSA